jgi:hypothetical protein
MAMTVTCGPGTLIRSDVVACIAHLRAFAIMLAGDGGRAEDLVCATIEQTFSGVNWPPTGVDLKIQMFAVLHGLHYGALRPSTKGSAQQRESPSSNKDGLESDELLRIFGRLRDERREALILTIASGLSYQQAAGRGMRMPDCRHQKQGLGGLARDIAGFGFAVTGDKLGNLISSFWTQGVTQEVFMNWRRVQASQKPVKDKVVFVENGGTLTTATALIRLVLRRRRVSQSSDRQTIALRPDDHYGEANFLCTSAVSQGESKRSQSKRSNHR